MLPICDEWIKQVKISEHKSQGLFELSHLLYCNQSSCVNQKSLNKQISLLTSTIKHFKKVRCQLRQKQKKLQLKENYYLPTLIKKVFNGFDLWYNVLKFNTVNSMIAHTRICKYWHQNTIQTLSQIRFKLIGNKDRIDCVDKLSMHLWFSNLLHLDLKTKKNLIVLGLDDKINLILKNLQLPFASPLPLTLDVWIQECQNFPIKYYPKTKWNLEWLRIYFYQFPDQINLSDENGSRLIHWACETGYVELVKMLLTYNQIDLSQNGADNNSTLSFAIQGGNISIIKLLVEKKISINTETFCEKKKNYISYPLHLAITKNQIEIIELLLDNGANPFLLTNENKNAFDLAVNYNYYRSESYKLLIQNFIKFANKWNIKYTIEIKNRHGKDKLCFVINDTHFYTIPASLGDVGI